MKKLKRKFKIIACIDLNRGLGFENKLPWSIPKELEYFYATTTSTKENNKMNSVIMGRTTSESIPDKYFPLKERNNIVITRDNNWVKKGVKSYSSLEEAINSNTEDIENIFIIGGSKVYNKAISMDNCSELLLTTINKIYECDTFFPEYKNKFELIKVIDSYEHKGIKLSFEQWIKKY